MPRYGVIDLGSNSVRLVIYEVRAHADHPLRKKDFRALVDEKKMAGLSAYVQDGRLSDAGVAKAVDVLEGHLRLARDLDCDKTGIFATAVLRNCANSAEAVAAIEDAIGAPIDLLPGEEEARLDFVGASCDRALERGTLIDVGGGSTELVRVEDGRDARGVSLDQGCVSSYAQFVRLILPTPDEADAIRGAFAGRLAALPDAGAFASTRLYGVGGSVRGAAKLLGALTGAPKATRTITRAGLAGLLALLRDDPSAFAHLATRAVPDRLHSIVPGCLIVATLMEHLGADELEVCKHAIREGYLIERLAR
ncbi:MAG: exopolyphosphatase [Eggerthellaceae bacterium]|nr:exopolyphosphatase [Eggerthellaceae bacterium]